MIDVFSDEPPWIQSTLVVRATLAGADCYVHFENGEFYLHKTREEAIEQALLLRSRRSLGG